tara:strand:+ start:509 stop:1003 length:495 start_codon:yes stop_codon:yes gene_type:complete
MMQQMFLGYGGSSGGVIYSDLATSMTNSQGSATLANMYLMFDGSGATSGWGGGTNGAAAATVSFTNTGNALSWSSKIEIMGSMGATSSQVGGNSGFMKVNGYDIVPEMKTANQYYLGDPTAFVDITSKVGSSGVLSSIALQWIGGAANPSYFGIRLDNTELIDS